MSALGLTGALLQAAPYTSGDLFLGFVAGAGTGSTVTVLVDLGPASGYRDAFDSGTNKLNFVSIGTQLATQYGAAWYERPDLYVSLFACTDKSATSSTLFSKDPARTLYASAARGGPGTPGTANSPEWLLDTNTAMTDSAATMADCASQYAADTTTADAQGLAVISVSDPRTLDEYTQPVTTASFGNFNGGIEQTFAVGSWGTLGDAGAVEAALDLYRLQAKNNIAGQYGLGDPIREGVYKGTITLSQTGAVSFIVKGDAPPTDGFDTWAVSKGLPTGVATDDDRDNDGIPALTEYALDLNPLAFDTLPAPVPATGGGLQLTFAKGAAAAADAKISYQIESSSTLNADWAALVPTVNDATQISSLLPPGNTSGRLFGRLKITKSN